MHLPDGTINNQASLTFVALSGAFVFWAIKEVKEQLCEKVKSLVPQLTTEFGSLEASKISSRLKIRPEAKKMIFRSALIFSLIYLVQLFDFPLINGVSGHLIGAALAGIALGPALGMLVMSSVLIVQSLFLHDGGILALGANIFNMAIIGSAGGYYLYVSAKKYLPNYLSIFIATFCSVILSALAFGLVMFISHRIVAHQLVPEILLPHLIVGLVEGILTLFAIKYFFPKANS